MQPPEAGLQIAQILLLPVSPRGRVDEAHVEGAVDPPLPRATDVAGPLRSRRIRPSTLGAMIENERTGERVEFVQETSELLCMNVTWTTAGARAVRHAHPGMEERWEILEGRAAFEVDRVTVEAGPGSWVVAPKGRPHLAWNPTEEPVRLRIEMRPALRWSAFVRRLFSGEDPAQLLEEYRQEIVLAPPRP